MDRFLLDASALLNILEGNREGVKTRDFVRNGELVTSVICKCEVINKANLIKQAKAEELLSRLIVFAVTVEDGETAVQIQNECRQTGRQVPTLDALIAATAANNGAILVTSDKDFERIDGLRKKVLCAD